MSKLIFISPPYNHSDPAIVELNYYKVGKFATKLVSEGNVAISPIVYGHNLLKFQPDMPGDWKFWQNFCFTLLEKADEMIVYKMEGWDKSRGVSEEIEFAKQHNIPIKYVEYELL